jgi:hypothetical protein
MHIPQSRLVEADSEAIKMSLCCIPVVSLHPCRSIVRDERQDARLIDNLIPFDVAAAAAVARCGKIGPRSSGVVSPCDD